MTTSIEPFLRALVETGGSDLHVKVGSPPRVRIDGKLRKLQTRDLTAADTDTMVREVLREDLVEEFERTNEADFAYSLSGVGRLNSPSTPPATVRQHTPPAAASSASATAG